MFQTRPLAILPREKWSYPYLIGLVVSNRILPHERQESLDMSRCLPVLRTLAKGERPPECESDWLCQTAIAGSWAAAHWCKKKLETGCPKRL